MEKSSQQKHRLADFKAKNEKLRQKTYRNRYAVLENFYEGYYEVDLRGSFTYVNQALCDNQGYRAEELLGQDSKKFVPPQTKQKVIDFFLGVLQTGTSGRLPDYEFIHKNGTLRYIDLFATLIQDEQGNPTGFCGVARDCTEERLKTLELERYRDFVESIEDGCFEVDLDGTYTFVNAAICHIHGYQHGELIGMNHRNYALPEEAKAIYKVFNKIYRTGIPAKIVDYSIFKKDGTVRNLEVTASLIRNAWGHPIGFRGITRDRTERVTKERELERHRAFVEDVEDGCFEVDLRGNTTFCNAAACGIFGYPAEKFLGMNNRSYTSPESAKRIYKVFNRVYRTGQPGEISDYEIICEDGQRRYLYMTASLICNPAGKPVGFRGICKDITDRKKAEAEKKQLLERVNHAKRLEGIATLAAGVAHNFNNLLMSIQGSVSLMLLDMEKEHPHYSWLKTTEKLINRGSELTNQLLGYARHVPFKAKPTDIKNVLNSAILQFKSTAKISISHNLSDQLWPVFAASQQIKNAFLNLFENAVEAMKDGGSLNVETRNVRLQEDFVKLYDQQPGPYVRISVSDTGVGMDPTTLDRIFEPFFSTKNSSKGAGLGLASVYGIIKSHGGIILVESETDKGTTFTIFLPAIPPET